MELFADLAWGDASLEHQKRRGSFERYEELRPYVQAPAGLGPAEQEFLSERDSFYLASAGPDGWPYIQHRGGPAGFLKVLSPTQLAWAEERGNAQFITAGNLDRDDRVAMIAVDYPTRRRLKLLARARYMPDPAPAVLEGFGVRRADAIVVLEVAAFDWNCPKNITPRYTAAEVEAAAGRLAARIRELEAELARRPEPGRPEPGRPEPGRPEPGRPEPGRREPGREGPGPTGPGRH